MGWFDALRQSPREAAPLPPRRVPGLRYDIDPRDPDPVPEQIVLTRADGSEVVYVPQRPVVEPRHPAITWRSVNEPWAESS